MPSVLFFTFLPCEVAISYCLFESNFVSDMRLLLFLSFKSDIRRDVMVPLEQIYVQFHCFQVRPT